VTREEALKALKSSSSVQRLKAARSLLTVAEQADNEPIRQAMIAESDAWVRAALASAVKGLQGPETAKPTLDVPPGHGEPDQVQSQEFQAQATKEVTAMLLHELNPMVGRLRLSARSEVPEFATSKTNTAIERIRLFIGAVQTLNESSSPPQWQELDLTDLAVTTCDAERAEPSNDIRLEATRDDPLIVLGDPALLRLALSNAIRNAIESVAEFRRGGGQSDGGVDIVVTWGVTDQDAWIAVLDRGVGLPSGFDRAIEPWTTTKSKETHLGIGLTLANRALESLNGTVGLRPQGDHGAICELRWSAPKRR
jgi:signal transduction histidine kinase